MKYYRKTEYTPPARCFSNCVYCGRGGRIKEMWSIYLKRDSFSSTRLLYHVCDNCLKKHLEKMEVAMPVWPD